MSSQSWHQSKAFYPSPYAKPPRDQGLTPHQVKLFNRKWNVQAL